ncbi:mannosylphosphate transferase [Histoplasma capsulatum G186AR]|uniref:Mannosylphosphate transferase n=1 Tax=Ajellomyces capsulatus TaxID=5037 RepID=A0A8H7ZC93_AJECA|nr:mannosylphosphate transferase [Histoplasma capsulatum]QSS75908.1 mannosylphosphate transferase [Histoplasma capsulatum G186AR]
MRLLSWRSLLLVTSLCAHSLPSVSAVSFFSHNDLSRRNDREEPPEEKYFHEPGNDDILGHYDTRFFKGAVTYEERTDTLVHMTRAYLTFFRENGLETWIAHGTLLGWWWNGKMLPWDWDIDTQVNTATLYRMADTFNHTIYRYDLADDQTQRKYLLDVNPHARRRDRGQGQNIIDARWIDMRNGLYIDITGVSEVNPETEPGILQCKNFHKYETSDLYPMRESMYEGVPAKIPYKYHEILIKEYGQSAMVVKEYEDHNWVPELKLWVPDKERMAETAKLTPEERKKKQDEERSVRQNEIEQDSGRWG